MTDDSDSKVELDLDDLEFVDQIVVSDPAAVKLLRELKEQGSEGIKVSIETT